MKKYSILSLVLVGVSAAVAAMVPSKKAPAFANCNGLAVDTIAGSGVSYTCEQRATGARNCYSTDGVFNATSDGFVTQNVGSDNQTTTDGCVVQS